MVQNAPNAPPSRITVELDYEVAQLALKVQEFIKQSRQNGTGGFGEIQVLLEFGKIKRFKCTEDFMMSRLLV